MHPGIVMSRSAREGACPKSGAHRVTSLEVAAAAGVSQATVSNVLNRPELVAAETREKVIRVMESLNFVVNRSARDLRTGGSETCGVIVLDIANRYE